jgi:hypothetical protein
MEQEVFMNAQMPSPALFFDVMHGHQKSAAIKAAVDLNLFTAIGEGATSAKSIAEQCKASERGIRILCDFLTIQGFLTKTNSAYALTVDTAFFLDRRSPAYMGSAVDFLVSPVLQQALGELSDAVRQGGTTIQGEGSMEPDHPMWVQFARSMAPMMVFPAEAIASILGASEGKRWKVLDIAAGHGIFGITIAKHNPNAEIVAVDWKNVLTVATENARAAGVQERHHARPGSAFDVDLGTGYDLVLLTNFLHHFDPPTNVKLLRRVHAATAQGGRVATLEFIPNEDRVSPPVGAGFSLTMLATTPRGDAYTFPELERMFREAGFARSELHDLAPSPQGLVVSYR